jgi:hypothetical protein
VEQAAISAASKKAREAVRARLMGGDFMRAVAAGVNFVGMLAVPV